MKAPATAGAFLCLAASPIRAQVIKNAFYLPILILWLSAGGIHRYTGYHCNLACMFMKQVVKCCQAGISCKRVLSDNQFYGQYKRTS
jgi:hypothetical protein